VVWLVSVRSGTCSDDDHRLVPGAGDDGFLAVIDDGVEGLRVVGPETASTSWSSRDACLFTCLPRDSVAGDGAAAQESVSASTPRS